MQSQIRPHSRQASISAPFPIIDPGTYLHSPAHHAVACKDHAGLRKVISGLPTLSPATDVHTESDAIAEEAKAEALSDVIDNRDVPGRETPLHLAVRLGDAISAEILMSAGADCSLQNENGWSSLQEAICARQDAIAKIIVKHYQQLGWAKWCRRLPRIVAGMNRMRDFYMEVSFNFESSVIPLIARAAPSDTYRIWKRGPNLRADMTLSGFDGFKIQRSGQTFFFLGEGSKDGRLPAGSLCVLDHKSKVIANALDGADKDLTDNEVAQEVTLMARTNLYRPGIDVTQAVLVPQLSWMWQEKVEIVNGWKAKVYDMHNVMLSVKTRRVPGAMTDEEFFQSLPNLDGRETSMGEDCVVGLLQEKERKRHGETASTSRSALEDADSKYRPKTQQTIGKEISSPTSSTTVSAPNATDDRKGWFGRNRRTVHQEPKAKPVPPRSSLSSATQVNDLLEDREEEHAANKAPRFQRGRRSIDAPRPDACELEEMATYVTERRNNYKSKALKPSYEPSKESEYKKGLRPALWLTPDYPLRTEELLPLLDILASKVKAVRRLRELLTTKFPPGTFPVKIAFPVVPTIRVVITFSRFQEVQSNDEFPAPSISYPSYDDEYQSSWLSWIKGPMVKPVEPTHSTEKCDPFTIPKDYKWNKPVVNKKGKAVATKR